MFCCSAMYIIEPASPSEQNAHVLLTIFAIIWKAPRAGRLGENTKRLTQLSYARQDEQRKAELMSSCPLTAPSPAPPEAWFFAFSNQNVQSLLLGQQGVGNRLPAVRATGKKGLFALGKSLTSHGRRHRANKRIVELVHQIYTPTTAPKSRPASHALNIKLLLFGGCWLFVAVPAFS